MAVILLSSITPLSILPLWAHLMLQLYAVLMVRCRREPYALHHLAWPQCLCVAA